MNSHVHTNTLRQHAGLARMIHVSSTVRHWFRGLSAARGMAGVLVAAVAAAVIVAADQIVGTWADGHLLLAWSAMWAIVFALLAVFSNALRSVPETLRTRYAAWARAVDERAQDERTWAVALSDPRFMADLQVARQRAENEALAAGREMPHWPFANMPTQRSAYWS